jgi:hypothetical protein
MTTEKYLSIFTAVAVAVLISLNLGGATNRPLGSVAQSNDYYGTTTDATWNSAPNHFFPSCTQALASVIVIGATAGSAFELRDATSTTDSASTSIQSFPSSMLGGTYTFDTKIYRGLVARMTSGNIASTSITCR